MQSEIFLEVKLALVNSQRNYNNTKYQATEKGPQLTDDLFCILGPGLRGRGPHIDHVFYPGIYSRIEIIQDGAEMITGRYMSTIVRKSQFFGAAMNTGSSAQDSCCVEHHKVFLPTETRDLKKYSRGRRRQRRQNNKTNYTRQKAHVNM